MTSQKTYSGRFLKGLRVVRVRQDATSQPLRCLDFCTPSFGWGYHGGAADELAIAILHDHLGGTATSVFQGRVLQMYRAFVEDIISKFDRDGAWSLGENSVAKWVRQHEHSVVAV